MPPDAARIAQERRSAARVWLGVRRSDRYAEMPRAARRLFLLKPRLDDDDGVWQVERFDQRFHQSVGAAVGKKSGRDDLSADLIEQHRQVVSIRGKHGCGMLMLRLIRRCRCAISAPFPNTSRNRASAACAR